MEVAESVGVAAEILLIDKPTSSMVDTLRVGMESLDTDVPVVIKDVDNFVKPESFEYFGSNFVVFASLHEMNEVTAGNKSFIQKDSNGLLTNIVEKRIISPEINTGLIGFESASEFLRVSNRLSGYGEKHVSDVIREMLQLNAPFRAVKAESYRDWGELKDWNNYKNEFSVLIIRLEGVLMLEQTCFALGKTELDIKPIHENVQFILDKMISGKIKLVLVTSIQDRFRENLTNHLSLIGFLSFELIMGVPNTKTFVIDSFSRTKMFPNAMAINMNANGHLQDHLG
jgi:hypothetical protein